MEPYTNQPTNQTSLAIPIAIVVGFGLIAAAIFFSSNSNSGSSTAVNSPSPLSSTTVANTSPTAVRPVDTTDYIRGNPNAQILLIEYSDYDCPFCKQFHETMRTIMDDYGSTSRVAWVYRQFPIEQLHPNAPRISEAALCVGDIGGNEAFWTFSDLVFSQRDISQTTNMTRLPNFAEQSGVSVSKFNECVSSGRMRDVVATSYEEALAAGATGTPYTFLLVGDQQIAIDGAQPYEVIRDTIENILRQIDGVPRNTQTSNEENVPQ